MKKYNKEEDNRTRTKENVVIVLSILIYFIFVLIACVIQVENWLRSVIALSGIIPIIIGILIITKIEQKSGYYECEKCHYQYTPKYLAILLSRHVESTRYLKCPKCGEKSWNKKITKTINDKL